MQYQQLQMVTQVTSAYFSKLEFEVKMAIYDRDEQS